MKIKILISLACLFPFSASAWEPCGTDYRGQIAHCEYQIDTQGTLTIRGTDDIGNIGRWEKDSKYPNAKLPPWSGQNVTNIVIEDSIKDMGYEGLYGMTSQNPIVVPSSITVITEDAFQGTNTPEVIIPNSVTELGKWSFSLSSIEKISIPDSVTSIGEYAFYSAKQLTDIYIPDSVTSIGPSAFAGCTALETLTISDATNLDLIFHNYGQTKLSIDPQNLKIYCTGDVEKCNQNLANAGYTNINTLKADTKQINGITYVYDNKGKLITKSGNRKEKRIYTIEEANEAAGAVNRVTIRYK